jgi:hypothetical protein
MRLFTVAKFWKVSVFNCGAFHGTQQEFRTVEYYKSLLLQPLPLMFESELMSASIVSARLKTGAEPTLDY